MIPGDFVGHKHDFVQPRCASLERGVAAYGAEAIRACEAADDRLKLARLSAGSIDMTVGDRSRAVALWQVDHIDWAGRYRRVYLDVKTTGGDITCRFDVAGGAATPSVIRP